MDTSRTWRRAAAAGCCALAVATVAGVRRQGRRRRLLDRPASGPRGRTPGRAPTRWPPGGRVEIVNINGQIDAEAADGATRRGARRARRHGRDRRRRPRAAGQDRDARGGRGRPRADRDRWRREIRLGGLEVGYTVQRAGGRRTSTCATVNGGVRLDNVGGEVRATPPTAASRDALAAASVIDARTTNGGVELELTGAFGADGPRRRSAASTAACALARAGGHQGRRHAPGAPTAASASSTWPSTSEGEQIAAPRRGHG